MIELPTFYYGQILGAFSQRALSEFEFVAY